MNLLAIFSNRVLLLVLTLCWLSIQRGAAQQALEDLQFLPVEAKLSQNTAASVLQDKNGFLWIGTRNGLNRYDGINTFEYYHDEQDSSTLSNNYIRVLYEGGQGEIWIGTDGGGLCKYNEFSDSFIRIGADGTPNSISTHSIYSIYEDKDGSLWVGTQNSGLFRYDFENGEFQNYRKNSDDPFSISSNYITGIARDKSNNLWIGTWSGLNLFDTNTKRFIRYMHNGQSESVSADVIRCLHMDASGDIFIGTNNGLDKLVYKESGRFVFEHITLGAPGHNKVVLCMLTDSNNQLWVGSENQGIFILDVAKGKVRQHVNNPKYEYSIKNNSVWSLYEDNTGIIWIGTFNKGLYKVDDHLRKFRSYKHSRYYENSPSGNSVSSFIEDKSGNVWIGTDGGGLDHWNRRTNIFKHYNASLGYQIKDEVLSLMLDSKETLWVGTWYGGIVTKARNSNRFVPFPLKHAMLGEPGRENIFAILEDSQKRIWMAIYREGLLMYDTKTNDFHGFQYEEWDDKTISSNFVRCLMEDNDGTLWVGTEGGGLNHMREKDGKFVFDRYLNIPNNPNSICSNSVLTIVKGANQDLWLGTTAGLANFDKKTGDWIKYGKREGLPDEVIYGIQLDAEDNVWFSSNRGLSKLDPMTKELRNYDQSDGLQSMEFFKNSSYKLSTGELLFGGVEGFNVFYPSLIKDNEDNPQVYLVDFKVSNESVSPGSDSPISEPLMKARDIELGHDQNDFSFEFALLNFSQSSRNEYAYQLVNYDHEWQEAGTRREAYYTNVPPGNYTFRVRGTTNDGRWSPLEASINISVARAWYSSYFAYLIYIIAVLGSLIWAFRAMVNRERLQTQLQLEHMELSKMHELDEMKSSFFANISHEFRSPLTLILGPLKVMKEKGILQFTQDQVDLMIRNAESLLNLINQLLELSKLESGKMRLEVVEDDICQFLKPVIHSFSSLANQKFINYKVVLPKNKVMLYFDKDKMEKIVVNLISNALKFTSDFGSIRVQLEDFDREVVISVRDTGAGIPKDEIGFVFNRYYRVKSSNAKSKSKGTGIGLSLTKELVEIHDGRIYVESEQGKGSVFKVHLKKGMDHFDTEDIVESQQAEYLFDKREFEQLDSKVRKQTISDTLDNFEDQMSKLPIVLVIEDNEDIRSYVRQILESEYRIIESGNGREGLEIAFEKIPDLIISDVMIPDLDGFEVCKKVKADVRTSHIPVVLLTAKASNDSAVEGFEVGADYYITKPFNPKLLSLRVRNALNIKNQIKEQLLNKESFNLEPSHVKIDSKDQDFINKAIAIVEENMANSDFYVDDLGKELGMSRMQLYRKLKGLINQSANEFVRSIRLKRAAQLISQDKLTISEITYQVGFNDLQYFRDCFKKQFGVNPSEYATHTKKDAVK